MTRRIPRYVSDTDYNTNAPSYYDDLARKQKLIEVLSLKISEYDKELSKRFEEWDKNLEELPNDVVILLEKWMEDGTLDDIINNNIFEDLNGKIDNFHTSLDQRITDVNDLITLVNTNLTNELEQEIETVTNRINFVNDSLTNDIHLLDSKVDLLNESVFNVLSYGAKLDGITDDTLAFQLCADDVEENGGGVFHIPYTTNQIIISGM